MIGTIDILLQAHNPNFPLEPVFTFVNSSQSFRIRNAPKKIGQWNITSVAVNISYPDNSIVSKKCVLTGGIWVATVDGCATSGSCTNGFVVTASGIDENGQTVSNYVLGAGDLFVKELDGTIAPGTTAAKVYFYDTVPANPKKGDAAFIEGTLNVWDGTTWRPAAEFPDVSGKLDGAAAYPAWEQDVEYSLGEIVSYQGGLYRCIGAGNRGWPPLGTDVSPYVWQPYTVKDVIAVLAANMSYARHGVTLTDGAGTLLDRASNCVVASAATTLTHPAALADGKLRDYLVRLELLGSSVPTITFAAPTGETIIYETDGDEFPVPDDTGSWLYSFTESDASKFAVSLKKLNEVAQGGA